MKKAQKKTASKKKKHPSPDSLSSAVYDTKGKKVSETQLDAKLFGHGVNIGLLHRVTLAYQANQRSGCASTKTRKFIRGGGKKPWRQKGTGRARTGSIRNPIWRGGGVIFGPHPRDYSHRLPAGMKKAAIKSSLNSKHIDGRMRVLDKLELKEPKTKQFSSILSALKIKESALVVLESIDENIKRASRNIPDVTVKTLMDFNALDVLKHENFVITETALKNLRKRI